jgi:hypothetical protein
MPADAVKFTHAENAAYSKRRLRDLKQTGSSEWRGITPGPAKVGPRCGQAAHASHWGTTR